MPVCRWTFPINIARVELVLGRMIGFVLDRGVLKQMNFSLGVDPHSTSFIDFCGLSPQAFGRMQLHEAKLVNLRVYVVDLCSQLECYVLAVNFLQVCETGLQILIELGIFHPYKRVESLAEGEIDHPWMLRLNHVIHVYRRLLQHLLIGVSHRM